MKVLGMLWEIYSDQISITIKDCATGSIYNKRQIMKEAAEVFLGVFFTFVNQCEITSWTSMEK